MGLFKSLLEKWLDKKLVRNSLSGAENEANAFNSAEAQKARDWQEEQYLKYNSPQAMVRQMQEAGLNPALMYGTSPASTASPSVSSVAPSSSSSSSGQSIISDIINLANVKTDIDLKKSEAEKNRSQTTGQDIDNGFKDTLNSLNVEASRSQIRSTLQGIEESLSRVSVNEASVLKIGSERVQLESQADLNRVRAYVENLNAEKLKVELSHVDALLTAQQSLYDAQTSTEVAKQAELYRSAALSLVQSQKEQGLLDAGYCESVVAEINAKSDYMKTQESGEAIRNSMLEVEKKWQKADKWIGASTEILKGIGTVAAGAGTGAAQAAKAVVTYRGR